MDPSFDPGEADAAPGLPGWEQAGAVRRDCASHHGAEFAVLGNTALILAILSLPCCCAPLSLASFPLCLAVRRAAGRDLERMDRGLMDPHDDGRTETARKDASLGMLVSGLSFVVSVICV